MLRYWVGVYFFFGCMIRIHGYRCTSNCFSYILHLLRTKEKIWQWRHKGASMSDIQPSQFQGLSKPSTIFLSNFGFLALFHPHLPPQDAAWSWCQWPLSLAGLRSRTGHSADHQHSGRIYCVLVVGKHRTEAFKENACTKFGYLYLSICMRCLVHLHAKRQPKRQRCFFYR